VIGLAIAVGFSLTGLNLVTEFVFLKVTLLERHKSKSGMQLSMVYKKLIVEVLNNIGRPVHPTMRP